MNDFYEDLKKFKENNSLTYSELGAMISVSGDTFRMAMNRQTFTDLRKNKLYSIIRNEQNELGIDANLSFAKDGVRISIDEMLSFIIINIKSINNSGKLEKLIAAINTVNNIDKYNSLSDEIASIKKLLARNKDLLK